ncbi:ATP-dependent sacrificial sulfur transferase LarE [Lagierella sp.]|uniref:ATP-dependent sacrificial sulfur transferase LarE n=1 Tax=Lagierella sp. TaxID=2849657 RepID=UPI0026347F3C|nr:ATP-dependent sacrificial sulfur transferase LarE [Lagierella sp.]
MNLNEFFNEYKKVALAFSGGVDSAFLLQQAIENGVDITAYYVKSAFQPDFELEDAKRLSKELNAKLKIMQVDVFKDDNIIKNSSKRCYYCKKVIFGSILKQAKKDGYEVLLDGTNYSDDYDDRPGMRAKDELKVLSPLRMCKLTKKDIRKLSKEKGLFTWNKPSYSCLATRIPVDKTITLEDLDRTERAEDFLKSLGFVDFRVRLFCDSAKISVTETDLEKVIEHRADILQELLKYYPNILLDLEVRK